MSRSIRCVLTVITGHDSQTVRMLRELSETTSFEDAVAQLRAVLDKMSPQTSETSDSIDLPASWASSKSTIEEPIEYVR